MKKFDLEVAKEVNVSEPLPAGGYVAKVIDVEEEAFNYSGKEVSKLRIAFDIAEGDYEGYFGKKFKAGEAYSENKWKGIFRLTVPDETDEKNFEWQKRVFGGAIWCFEDSNDGFKWKWKEKDLIGKEIGVLYRNKEYDFNGYQGWTTECAKLASVNDIRCGNFTVPKDKALKKTEQTATPFAASASADFEEIKDDGELPF